MNKPALGKKGEMFVLSKLISFGYSLSFDGDFDEVDMAIKNKKAGRIPHLSAFLFS